MHPPPGKEGGPAAEADSAGVDVAGVGSNCRATPDFNDGCVALLPNWDNLSAAMGNYCALIGRGCIKVKPRLIENILRLGGQAWRFQLYIDQAFLYVTTANAVGMNSLEALALT